MRLPILLVTLVLVGGGAARAQQLDVTALPREGPTREVTPSRTDLSGSVANRQATATQTRAQGSPLATRAERDRESRSTRRAELVRELQTAVDQGDLKKAQRINKQLRSAR